MVRCNLRQVVEIDQQTEACGHLVALGQMRPAPLMNVPGSEAVLEVFTLDACQYCVGGSDFALRTRSVEAPRVALQIASEGQGPD